MPEATDRASAGVCIEHGRSERGLVQTLLGFTAHVGELNIDTRVNDVDGVELLNGIDCNNELVLRGFFSNQINGMDRGVSSAIESEKPDEGQLVYHRRAQGAIVRLVRISPAPFVSTEPVGTDH